ncbi:MAG: hypothetical protein CEE42_14585 [Promethearchaeota archaeon Loki_b31]|nr:MAG: hypothetical protein CEE42_14585 [Candidatus Lokiarchaeota archaeon Loki_b31]
MARMSLKEYLVLFVIFAIALGVYGLFFLMGLPSLGTIFSVITIIVLCCLSCFYPAMQKKKKIDKYKAEHPPDKTVLTPGEFKYCIRCNAAMDKNLKICTNCGQPFEV